MKNLTRIASLAVALVAAGGVHATDLVLRAGVADVDPSSSANKLVAVGSNATLSLGGTLFVTKNFAVDLLGALPFKHDITLTAAGASALSLTPGLKVASTKHLPPTLTAQWHFLPGTTVDPYVGVGVNYTNFFNKDTYGPIAGTKLVLPPSWGIAGEAGIDFNFGGGFVLSADVRYAKISTHAKVVTSAGAIALDLGDVNIDPMVYGINFGKHFDL